MFINLDKSKYKVIEPLLRNISYNRAIIDQILSSELKGEIYTENNIAPETVLIRVDGGFMYLTGKVNIDFARQAAEYFFNTLKLKITEIIILNNEAEKMIPFFYESKKNYILMLRKNHTFNPEKFRKNSGQVSLPIDFQISQSIENAILKLRLLYHGTEVANCLAFMGKHTAEISVFTNKEYRKKGFAILLVYQIIPKILDRDLIPAWSCWDCKKASQKLALKCGFEWERDYKAYIWDTYIENRENT